MKKIVSLLVFVLLMALYEPINGEASGFKRESSTDNQSTFFLNMAYMLTTGQLNSVTKTATNIVVNQSIINNNTRNIDGTNGTHESIVNGKSFSPLKEILSEISTPNMPSMTVKFLDVGQGDAIFIKYPNGKTALVDAGRNEIVIDSALKAENITQIDTFIATHPDADHIGGAAYVINNYRVKKVIDSGLKGTTQSFFNYLEAVKTSGVQFELAEIGDNISGDENISAKVLYVDSQASELNDGSIVIMLTYGTTDILLTADAEIAVEKYLINNYDLDAEILKVAHHGANTGTSQEFIDAVSPSDAILQYGYNLFRLPSTEVVNHLSLSGATIYSTHELGTITISTDGNRYTFKTDSPKESRKSVQTSNQIRISAKNLDGEAVTIKNIGNTSINMTGWILLSVKGHQTFTFPDGFVLKEGESVNLLSGPNAVDNPPFSLKWTESLMWNKKGDPAELYDPFGQLIHQLN